MQVAVNLSARQFNDPKLIELVRSGRVALGPLVTARYPLEKIHEGFDALRAGQGLRSIVLPGKAA